MNKFSFKRNPVLSFHRWSRKSYGVFASLHRVVRIAVVTFGCTLVQLSYEPVVAQATDSTNTSHEVDLDEIEVTGSQPVSWSDNARLVRVADRREINASPAKSLDDLLRTLAGVDIRQRGSDGTQADVSIRGGSFDQVLILLNGINITDPQTGHYNLDLPVDLQQIHRIELLRGPNARIFGPNAYSGVINIVTGQESDAQGLHLKAGLGAGSFGFGQLSGMLDYNRPNSRSTFSFSGKRSDGYRSNTDFGQLNVHFLQALQSARLGTFQFQSGYQQKAYGANSFYSLAYPNQFDKTRTLFASLSWNKELGKNHLSAQISDRLHHDRFELFRDMKNAASWYTGHNYHLTNVTTGNFMFRHFSEKGKTTLGTEIRNEHILSNVLGNPLANKKEDIFDQDGVFTKSKNRTNYRLFADQSVYLNKLKLSAGLSANYHSDFGKYLVGGADAVYALTSSLSLNAGVNHSHRMPTFNDLYYKSATQISNPNLKPEQATTLEAGLQFSKGVFYAQGSVYQRFGRNVIDWIKHPDSTKWVSRNETKLNATGAEFSVGFQQNHRLIRRIELSYSALSMDKQASGYDSKYALDFLRNKWDLTLEHRLAENAVLGSLSACWNLNYQDRAGTYQPYGSTRLAAYKPFSTANLRVNWHLNRYRIALDVNNFTNVSYEDLGGLPQAGRSVRATFQYAF